MAPKRAAEEASAAADAKKSHLTKAEQEALVAETNLHDEADEEIDRLGIPVGWRECPKMGRPIFRFIPMKVPLGSQFDEAIEPKDRFTVDDAITMANAKVDGIAFDLPGPPKEGEDEPTIETRPAIVNMVIDLTNSQRYYRKENFEGNGFIHVKIPNRGRGEVPAPQAVNDFVFEVFSHLNRYPEAYILVHCTHGYNRTGFMIVSYLMRMLSEPTTKVLNVISDFAEIRSPGIYKNYYIKYLFKYYHERPPSNLPPPSLPPWKAEASPDHGEDDDSDDALLADSLFSGAVGRGLQHDDPLGEAVSISEGDWVRTLLMEYILDRPGVDPHQCMFPGSQPVSLARSNLELLFKHRYWVTWKADGTRYLIFIHRMGTYLIDRSNVVTRVQMRWPMPLPPRGHGHPPPTAPVGPFHVGTILDGEMVVDEDPKTKICTRRFLAYDMMVINGMKGLESPWGERWGAIKKYVEHPRRFEQEEAAKGKWKLRYDYAGELFRFRTKEFWPLHMADKVIHKFIPQMVSHEADGLILQPFADRYVPLTCPELLKWKFAHMNSVDFKARLEKADVTGERKLHLQLLRPQGKGKTAIMEDLPDAQVYFPEGISHLGFNGRIIECAWDSERNSWFYMRERKDKTLPNAYSVYESVLASITDDIREEELLKEIEKAVKGDVYDEDMGRKTNPSEVNPKAVSS